MAEHKRKIIRSDELGTADGVSTQAKNYYNVSLLQGSLRIFVNFGNNTKEKEWKQYSTLQNQYDNVKAHHNVWFWPNVCVRNA